MINLDERYLSYLHTDKCFNIDGVCEKVKGYGFECDSSGIAGYYVLTDRYKLHYNMDETFAYKEELYRGVASLVERPLWEREVVGSNPIAPMSTHYY